MNALIKLTLLMWESSSFFIFLPTLGILALLAFLIAVQYNSRSFEGFFVVVCLCYKPFSLSFLQHLCWLVKKAGLVHLEDNFI